MPPDRALVFVLAVAAGCGGQATASSLTADPRRSEDAGVRRGSGGAPETGPSESGGVLVRFDASVSGSGGTAGPPPLDEAGRAECDALVASARSDMTAAISLDCSDDSDCTLLDVNADCARGCPTAGRADSAPALAKAVVEANQRWCVDFRARGCFLQVPECLFTRSACMSAECHLAYTDLYRLDITNPIDSGDTVVVTKLDLATGTCVAAELFVSAGNAAPELQGAWLLGDARSCCPLAVSAAVAGCAAAKAPPCAWPAAAANPTGTARVGPGYTLDVDYSFSFPGVTGDVEFRATGLVQSSCSVP